MCLVSFSSYAFDHSFNVSGEDENGKPVEGVIYSNNGEKIVHGELSDENGNTHDFDGQWEGYGRINGEIDDGTSIELNIS